MEAMLTSLVERYLAQHLHANAIFYAERLFAQWPSEVRAAPCRANRRLHAFVGRAIALCLSGSRSAHTDGSRVVVLFYIVSRLGHR